MQQALPNRMRFGRPATPMASAKPTRRPLGSTTRTGGNGRYQPRPEQRDSKAVGGTVIPTPPAIPEQKLPHADNLPAKPPISGAGSGGSILPSLNARHNRRQHDPGDYRPRPAGPDLHRRHPRYCKAFQASNSLPARTPRRRAGEAAPNRWLRPRIRSCREEIHRNA